MQENTHCKLSGRCTFEIMLSYIWHHYTTLPTMYYENSNDAVMNMMK